jgi:CBS domain-containing membrane protein
MFKDGDHQLIDSASHNRVRVAREDKVKNRETAEDIMTYFPFYANPKANLRAIRKLIIQKQIRHLPIIFHEKVVGLISERDLHRDLAIYNDHSRRAYQFMIKNPYMVEPKTSISEISAIMAKNKYGCTLVVDRCQRMLGIITTVDILKLMSHMAEDLPIVEEDPDLKKEFSF